MPDLTAFDTAKASRTVGAPLRIDGLLTELDDDQAEALLAVLQRPADYNRQVICEVVTGWGHTLSPEAVSKWRARNVTNG